jgi:hypothetical protein
MRRVDHIRGDKLKIKMQSRLCIPFLLYSSWRMPGTEAAAGQGDEFPSVPHQTPFSDLSSTADSPPLPFWHHRLVKECKSSPTNPLGDTVDHNFHTSGQHDGRQPHPHQHSFGNAVDDSGFQYDGFDDPAAAFATSALGERGGDNIPYYGNDPKSRNADAIQTRRGTFSSRASPRSRHNSTQRRNPSPSSGRQSYSTTGGYHSPVIYQYFTARGSPSHRGHPIHQPRPSSQLNFLFFGPNVDHWKTVGPILASRGFNVMACERVEEDHDEPSVIQGARQDGHGEDRSEDAPNLILQIMGTWK